jgi:plastocyanin
MMKKLVFAFATLLAALSPACSTDAPPADPTDAVEVTLSEQSFSPATVTIKVGQTVRWVWAGGSHNVVSGAACDAPDDNFRSGAPREGGTFERLFEVAGTFPYYCEPHCDMGMKGQVVVQ